MTNSTDAPKVLHPDEIERFDRGTGVQTIPLIGKWNAERNQVTTGITVFGRGTGIPLHTHNVKHYSSVAGLKIITAYNK